MRVAHRLRSWTLAVAAAAVTLLVTGELGAAWVEENIRAGGRGG